MATLRRQEQPQPVQQAQAPAWLRLIQHHDQTLCVWKDNSQESTKQFYIHNPTCNRKHSKHVAVVGSRAEPLQLDPP